MRNDEIKKMTLTLIEKLGKKYPIDPYEPSNIDSYLDGYDLALRKYDSGAISICFAGNLVYSEIKSIHEPGDWEEILKLYYEKIPNIIQKEKDDKIREEKCKNISKILDFIYWRIMYHSKDETMQFDDNIKICIKKDGERSNRVFYNGEEVFYSYEYDGYDGVLEVRYEKYVTYIPGEWEDKLVIIRQNVYEEDKKKKTLSRLNELRNL